MPSRHVSARHLSTSTARRILLRAQALDRPRPSTTPTRAALGRAAAKLGVIQVDSVSVFARAHYLPLYSRLGPYDRETLDGLYSNAPHVLLEQWGHEACLVTPDVHRLLAPFRSTWSEKVLTRVEEQRPGIVTEIERVIADEGPLSAREVDARLADHHRSGPRREGDPGWWNWNVTKHALEGLFHGGRLASAGRNRAFERRFELAERIAPGAPNAKEDAFRELVRRSLHHLGIGTAAWIADYYRLGTPPTKTILEELAAEGLAEPVTIEGVRAPAWRAPGASAARAATGATLLSPFDPAIFDRGRLHDLFGVHYRIGIYTPTAKRTSGYYSLPFLLGERIVARYDLKADRPSGGLLVQGAFSEAPGDGDWPAAAEIARAAATELRIAAKWQGLGDVVVPDGAAGDAADTTRKALTDA